MTELVKYDAACRALAEAFDANEVLQIHDQAEAMRQAARIAGNKEFEIKGAQLRFRAERRFGELYAAQKAAGLAAKGGRPRSEKTPDELSGVSEQPREVTLRDLGVDHRFSSKAQRLADMPAAEFEAGLAVHAEEMRSGAGRVAMDLLKINSEQKQRAARRDLARTLSDASVDTSGLRVYPCIYADPPWVRKQGVGPRSYENHYVTMTWPEIVALMRQFRDRLLPDSWFFCWIPRAHLLALVEVEIEVEVVSTGELVIAKVMMPLAWAVAQAIGADAYSTCFVWTKTDEAHPDAHGTGKIAYDQDELLLLFRRGRGLPMPDGAEKYGSNHRERATDHSAKPLWYRGMLRDMVGVDAAGEPLPVLEMFARFDPENRPPLNWDLWGNQAKAPADDAASSSAPPARLEDEPLGFIGNEPIEDAARDFLPAQLEISEFDALKALSDFCHPRRTEICDAVAEDYATRGLAIRQGATDQWILREAGVARLRALEDERRAAAPPAPEVERDPLDIPEFLRRDKDGQLRLGLVVPAKPDIIDDHVQTRLPVNADELEEAIGLRAIAAGEHPGEMGRHLISKEWARWTTARGWQLTDEGQAALASFVDVPAPAAIEARP